MIRRFWYWLRGYRPTPSKKPVSYYRRLLEEARRENRS